MERDDPTTGKGVNTGVAINEMLSSLYAVGRRKLRWCWLTIAALLALCHTVAARQNADDLWRFSGYLFQHEDYYRAVGEYERFLFLFPGDPRAQDAELQIGRGYRLGGEPEKAFDHFFNLFNRNMAEPLARSALREMVVTREVQQQYGEAIYWARRYLALYPDDPGIDGMRLRLAWLCVDSGNYGEALATLESVPPQSSSYPKARSLIEAMQQQPYRAPKSPELAGTLAAVLPGAGHLYVGRPGQAAASFLLNGLFIGAAAAAFSHDSQVLGGILVFFELGWYEGGIRSAATAAREVNRQDEKRYRQELREHYRLSFGLVPGRKQIALGVRLDF